MMHCFAGGFPNDCFTSIAVTALNAARGYGMERLLVIESGVAGVV